jgi:hypothetical protein
MTSIKREKIFAKGTIEDIQMGKHVKRCPTSGEWRKSRTLAIPRIREQ